MENKLARLYREPRHFHAHETARFDALSGLPLASFKQRAWAIVIDVMAVLIVKSLFGMNSHHDDDLGPMTMAHLLMNGVEYIKELIESTLYFAVIVKLTKGQTLGKWLMKVRIVSLTHHELGWWQSIERALGYGASLLEGGFGFLQFFINRNRQTVHDRIAETIVIDERPTARRLGDVDHQEPELECEPDALEA